MLVESTPQTLDKYNEGLLYNFAPSANFCIALDWFQVFGRSNRVPTPSPERSQYIVSESLALRYMGYGRNYFKYLFEVYLDGEHVGEVISEPMNSEASTPEHCLLKIENSILYRADWYEVYTAICRELDFTPKSISRLDIALDGANEVKEFLSQYIKSDVIGQNDVVRIGKSKLTPAYNDKEKEFEYFRIGTPQSDKKIVVYNKTKEIETSNKKYIQRFWEQNGIQSETTYRTELRLNAKTCADIAIDIEALQSPEYLVSICRTHFKGFLEFRWNVDSCITRCPVVDLIDWSSAKGVLLERVMKKEVNDRYKAKLTVHLLFKLTAQNRIGQNWKEEVHPYILMLIDRFDLGDWFEKSVEKWQSKYRVDPAYDRYLVEQYIESEFQVWRHQVGYDIRRFFEGKSLLEIDFAECQNFGFKGDFNEFLLIWNQQKLKYGVISN